MSAFQSWRSGKALGSGRRPETRWGAKGKLVRQCHCGTSRRLKAAISASKSLVLLWLMETGRVFFFSSNLLFLKTRSTEYDAFFRHMLAPHTQRHIHTHLPSPLFATKKIHSWELKSPAQWLLLIMSMFFTFSTPGTNGGQAEGRAAVPSVLSLVVVRDL